jgi:hypothetical protein
LRVSSLLPLTPREPAAKREMGGRVCQHDGLTLGDDSSDVGGGGNEAFDILILSGSAFIIKIEHKKNIGNC